MTEQTVCKWRKRFSEEGLEGLVDAPRSGAPRTISDETVEAVLTKTLEGPPPNRTHWSRREMAKEMGIGQDQCRTHLEDFRGKTAYRQRVQTFQRPHVR